MQVLLKFFGVILAFLLGLTIAIAGFAFWAFYYPQKAWPVIRPLVISRDIQITWADSNFKSQKISAKRWHFEWTAKGLLFQRATPKLNFKTDVKIVGNVRISDPVSDLHFEVLELTSTEPGQFETAADPRAGNPANPHEQMESLKKAIYWLNRFVSADRVLVKVADFAIRANHLNVEIKKPGLKDPQTTEVSLASKGTDSELKSMSHLRMDQALTGQTFINGEFKGSQKKDAAEGTFEVAFPEAQAKILLKVKGNKGDTQISAESEALIQASQILIQGKTDAAHLPGRLPDLKGVGWNVNLPLWHGVVMSTLAGTMQVSAAMPLALISVDMRKQLEQNCKCKWPESLKVDLDGKTWASYLLTEKAEDRPIASLNFKVEPLNNPLIQLNMAGEVRITRDKDQSFHFSPTIDANVLFPNFQALKGFLESYKIVIPSPFDVLQGSIEGHIKTTLWQSDKGLVVPIEGKARLGTTEQKVNLDSKIMIYVPEGFKTMDIVMDFTIDDFTVELPPVDPIQGLPQLTKDSRLQLSPEGPKAADDAFKIRLMYGVRTNRQGAVRLLSKMARPAIPMSLDLDRTAKGDILGTMKVEPFELSYLHRTMNVDQLRVILDDRETADFAVDGRIRMDQTQAKIAIAISGSLRSPMIKLSSDPELSKADIISVLLYDRTTDQIAPSDRETVGSFDAAISDRAIGLFGLWVFASTPIRSFSYNPATKVYTATVQLTNGMTASIGTDWEEAAQLEVKKRVTKRWVLTASWAPTQEKTQSGKLVLQWEKRF